MIVLLSGQIKNIGDFLITDRARRLFEEFVDKEILILDRTKDLTPHLDEINRARFVVLCGGPAYAANIYKGIYPLVDDLSQIKVPIIPFGLGWSGSPAGKPEEFSFNEESAEFLKEVHKKIDFSSCRDEITEGIVASSGYKNVKMTGCPVWYDLNFIDKPFVQKEITKIVVTTPADPRLFWQTIKMVRLMKKEFPKGTFYLSFHRGIMPDKHTKVVTSIGYILMCVGSKLFVPGIKIKDIAYTMDRMKFYEDIDFHIGYRVHAHLYFLSRRVPTILINEDGRGMGMIKTLKMPMLNVGDKALFDKIKETIKRYKAKDYSDFKRAKDVFDEKFVVMREFLGNLSAKY